MQAHDALHKDDVEACHTALHAALGLADEDLLVAPLAGHAPFDREFLDLCRKHNVRAAYVSVGGFVEGKGARLISGGDAELVAFLDGKVRS